jgi:hypothetical protein
LQTFALKLWWKRTEANGFLFFFPCSWYLALPPVQYCQVHKSECLCFPSGQKKRISFLSCCCYILVLKYWQFGIGADCWMDGYRVQSR